jgi:hypothetical protein
VRVLYRVRNDKSLFRKEPEMFNGETFRAFLRQLETVSQENGRRVIVIAGNSKYHHTTLHAAWRLERRGRFGWDFLPPSSPELTRSSASGNEPGETVSTMPTSHDWPWLQNRSKKIRPLVGTEFRTCTSFPAMSRNQ